jgi:hypothetical protein
MGEPFTIGTSVIPTHKGNWMTLLAFRVLTLLPMIGKDLVPALVNEYSVISICHGALRYPILREVCLCRLNEAQFQRLSSLPIQSRLCPQRAEAPNWKTGIAGQQDLASPRRSLRSAPSLRPTCLTSFADRVWVYSDNITANLRAISACSYSFRPSDGAATNAVQ